ncbi:MAG: CAP domain-containing protein [Bacteroidales bacterium]|nr:CAP domain-containing protein [Bacteroidales bacterium]
MRKIVLLLSTVLLFSCSILDDDGEDQENKTEDNKTDDNKTEDNDNKTDDNKTDDNKIENKEVSAAFEYLNAVRQNPSAYSKEIGVDLSGVSEIHALKWNDILAKVAQERAEDMVSRNYFGHTDPDGYGTNIKINNAGYTLDESWYSDKSMNYFESLAAGNAEGKATVIQLINDGGASDSGAGHRRHLLGMDDFWGDCYDIGIGKAKGGDYGTYWCFLIAKHQF